MWSRFGMKFLLIPMLRSVNVDHVSPKASLCFKTFATNITTLFKTVINSRLVLSFEMPAESALMFSSEIAPRTQTFWMFRMKCPLVFVITFLSREFFSTRLAVPWKPRRTFFGGRCHLEDMRGRIVFAPIIRIPSLVLFFSVISQNVAPKKIIFQYSYNLELAQSFKI